jgi:hypothetical protein
MAQAQKLEAERLKAEQASLQAKSEALATEAEKEAQKKKQEEQAAKAKLNADEELLVPPAGSPPPAVEALNPPPTPRSSAPAAASNPAASSPGFKEAAGKSVGLGRGSAPVGGTGSAELDAKVKKAGAESLQRLTQQAQAAEKSDMKNIKPGSPEADWEQVINFVAEKGKFDEVAGGLESYVSLDEFSSRNFNEPYNRKMLSLVGGRDSRGNFGFSRIHAVDEDWSKDKDGNNVGLLYQFLLGRDGSLAKVTYVKLVKKPTGSEHVVHHQGLDISEAEGKARWEANRQYWVKKVVRNK